jgi:transmembrane sensor
MKNRQGGTVNNGRRSGEAVDWFVANEGDEELRRVNLLEWEGWCARQENRADYADVIRLHQRVGMLPRPGLPSRAELLEDVADELPVGSIQRASVRAARQLVRSPVYLLTWRRIVALVASVALLAVTSIFLFKAQGPSLPVTLVQSYATAPGAQRELLLPDGSNITMGGDTTLVIRFTRGARAIELDRGEAYFRVQHNPQRPFVVYAGVGATTAIGTAFAVRRYADHVQVWVREGAVEVAPLKEIKEVAMDEAASQQDARSVPVRLARGEEMSYGGQGGANAPHPMDPRLAAAWTEGHLVPLIYRGRLLTDVMADIQPYMRRRIVIDPTAADLQYTGIVVQEDIEAWIRDLPMIYPEVEVIDCRTSKHHVRGCLDPERIVIRSRLTPLREGPQSALR